MVDTLGQRIRELRRERGWTQMEVARRSGVDRGYLASIEIDKVKKPSAETFLKLARAFNIRPEELYQSAGYIRDARTAYQTQKVSPDELLERARIALPGSVPIYEEFILHAGEPVEPLDYVPVSRETAIKNERWLE